MMKNYTYSDFFNSNNRMLRVEWLVGRAVHFVYSSKGSRSQFLINFLAIYSHIELLVLWSEFSTMAKFYD